jgi:Tol biopolymer transport system component
VDANRRDAPQRLQLPPELRVAAAHQPAWSDHGLAFALFRGSENSDIYVAEVEGDHVRNATNLTSAYAAEWRNYPAWSTDGERIVFATLAGISTIDRTGSLDGLITGEGLIAPSWRPERG